MRVMISIQNRFLFIHVPKTGGNSIQDTLRDYSEDEIVVLRPHQDGRERFEVRNQNFNTTKHSTLAHYRSTLDRKFFRSLFKFAVIRNPWDMCISFYFSPHRGPVVWDRECFKEFVAQLKPLRYYIYSSNLAERTTARLGLRKIGRRQLLRNVDYILRFENLQSDFNEVCRILSLPKNILPHRNSSTKKNYSSYYDEELIDCVAQRFYEEINVWNYRFESE